MPSFTVVSSENDITIPDGWQQAKFTRRSVNKQSRSYDIIAKIERPFTGSERAKRVLFALAATVFSLGVALLLSQTVRDCFVKHKENRRFAVATDTKEPQGSVANKSAATPNGPILSASTAVTGPTNASISPKDTYKSITPPVGFENYGNSCWFASSLQILFSNRSFERIVRRPIKSEVVAGFRHEGPYYRTVTEEDLQKMKNIQTALITLIDRRAEKDSKSIQDAFLQLHETILKNLPTGQTFPSRGQQANPNSAIKFLSLVFGFKEYDFHGIKISSLLNPDEKTSDEDNNLLMNRLGHLNTMPELISIINGPNTDTTYDINNNIDLSKYSKSGEKSIYRIVGIAQGVPGHWYSYVRLNNDWYCCNDKMVSKTDEKIVINQGDQVILERVK